MTDTEEPKTAPPLNRAQRRAAGRPQAPQVNSRSGQIRAEREAQARSAAKSKPQMRK
ncbi:MAG: hypothetical protein ABI655_15895 [Phenylobacterium sp.]